MDKVEDVVVKFTDRYSGDAHAFIFIDRADLAPRLCLVDFNDWQGLQMVIVEYTYR